MIWDKVGDHSAPRGRPTPPLHAIRLLRVSEEDKGTRGRGHLRDQVQAPGVRIQVCISKIPLTKSRVSGAVVDHSKCQPDIDRYNRCCEAAEGARRAEPEPEAPREPRTPLDRRTRLARARPSDLV